MITVTALRKRRPEKGEPDVWISHGAVRGGGALWARMSPSGASFYFRYTDAEGSKRALALGGWDEDGIKGVTLAQAIERAGGFSKLYREGVKDLHRHVERERLAAETSRKAADEAARRAAEEATRGTLGQLLDAYIAHLERLGKQSAGDAKNLIKNHVGDALRLRRASELLPADFVPVFRGVVSQGHGRTAAKLRSYLSAAYSIGIKSALDASIAFPGEAFALETNPVKATGSLSQFNATRDRNLNALELGALLRRLADAPQDVLHDALRLQLYLGGQRPAQLVRVRRTDVDVPAATVTLQDSKGSKRRQEQPRAHVLPLTKEAMTIVQRQLGSEVDSPFLFATEKGKHVRAESLSRSFQVIATAMAAAGEAAPFELRDVRRTAETMLRALKISSDVCAHLQSHGLGGVQEKHYNRYAYALEKKQALEKWARHLATLKAGKSAEVIEIGGKRRRGQRQEAPTP
ncbi:MAG TPA: integrase family protein [Steroidobacteraceae bacterium]|nr:integrase family protein [Steroidobacteraceae bacterium]